MRRKEIRRWIVVLVTLMLAVTALSAAAEEFSWTCPKCGQAGNTGNFCPNCGTARPDVSDTWICLNCGQEENEGNFCSNCGASAPIYSEAQAGEKPIVVNEQLEQIPGETDRVKVCLWNVQASSYITNKSDPNRWAAANAADGDESTCWQFSSKKSKLGKTTLELFIASGETVDEIWFKNGFWAYNDKGKDQYPLNARPKEIRVAFQYSGDKDYSNPIELQLADNRQTWQAFSVGHQERVTAVQITVLSAYKGTSFPNDVCLSEVMLVQHAPAATAKEPPAYREATVYESRPDVTGVGLKMKLATRSGPGTRYDEPGTFFPNDNWKNVTVLVLGKQYENGTWWVLVDFDNGGKGRYRVWTGLKRVDVDLNKVRDYSYGIGQGTVDATSQTYRGPGGNYAKAGYSINGWVDVVALARENGYVEVEFEYKGTLRRVWVPESAAHIDWGNDFSGEQ